MTRSVECLVMAAVVTAAAACASSTNRVSPKAAPAQTPDSVPAWVRADSNFAGPSAYIPVKFRKTILGIRFRREATQAQRHAAIDLVSGTVVVGLNGGNGNGLYLVRVAERGDGSVLVRASKQLQALPYVLAATPDVAFGLQ